MTVLTPGDDSKWTSTIPASLVLYQYLEELPSLLDDHEYDAHVSRIPYLTHVPQPPILPRILDKVILNTEPRRTREAPSPAMPAGVDDNSILPVPNHVVLNHLTASAIKNGTLGVGTTTRYRKKYITTMYFKPTLNDLMDGQPPTEGLPPVPDAPAAQQPATAPTESASAPPAPLQAPLDSSPMGEPHVEHAEQVDQPRIE